MGINKIEGSIIVEQNLQDAGPIAQWEIEDVAWPYGAGLYGFNWRDNTVAITPATGEVVPEAPGLEVCVEKARSNDLVRGINSNHRPYTPADPADKRWTVNATVPDPAAVFCAQLRRTLENQGIEIGDEALSELDESTPLYTHKSASYGDIMRSLMVRSDNLFAEGMLRTLAPDSGRKAAINRERELWATRGINTRYTIINDGSGLTQQTGCRPTSSATFSNGWLNRVWPTLTPRSSPSRQGRHYAWIPRKIETERTYCTQNRLC